MQVLSEETPTAHGGRGLMAGTDLQQQFSLLAEHHREAEHIGQRMADELAKFSDGAGGKERMALVAEWNAHQWPNLEGKS